MKYPWNIAGLLKTFLVLRYVPLLKMLNVLEFQFISFFHDDRTKFQRVVFQRWNKIINGGKMEL